MRNCNGHSRHIPQRIKWEIWGSPCVICGLRGRTVIDHIIPFVLGGSSERDNLQPLCQQCNARKKHKRTNAELLEMYLRSPEAHRANHVYALSRVGKNFYDD